MGIQPQSILAAYIVNLLLTSVELQTQTANQIVPSGINDDTEAQGNFQYLFDSIAKNNKRENEISHDILKRDEMRERRAFDGMKNELQITRNQNAYKRLNSNKKMNVTKKIVLAKRETKIAFSATDQLFEAAQNNDFKTVKGIIEGKGVPANAINGMGQTVAHIAATNGHREMLYYIVDREPTVLTVRDYKNITILRLVVERKAMDVLDYLRDKYKSRVAGLNILDFGSVALQTAIHFGDMSTITYLVDWMHVDVDFRGAYEKPPIFTAIEKRRYSIFRYLMVEAHANMTVLDVHGSNILFEMVDAGDLATMKYILDQRKEPLDLNLRNLFGDTPLHKAVLLNHTHIVEYLVGEKGANVNVVGGNRMTPLHLAAWRNHREMYDYLIEHGADVGLLDFEGRTAAQRRAEAELIESYRQTDNVAVGARVRRSLSDPPPFVIKINEASSTTTTDLNTDVKKVPCKSISLSPVRLFRVLH